MRSTFCGLNTLCAEFISILLVVCHGLAPLDINRLAT